VTTPQPVLEAIEASFQALKDAGATIIDLDAQGFVFPPADGEFFVLLYDFKGDVATYFKTRVGVPVAGGNLQSAIDFNNAHADVEMPFFNQDIFELAQTIVLDPNHVDPNFGFSYNQALDIDQNAGVNGIDAAIKQFNLDAVVSATDNPAWATDLVYGDHFIFGTSGLAAPPGYPIVQVPAGVVFGVPLGISFFGTAFSEPTLIKLASGYEAVTQVRAHNLPTFAQTIPSGHIQGTTPSASQAAVPKEQAPDRAKQAKRKPRHM
jgi:amidase